MRVSLIMSCYNSIENYRASMESALLQDYPDLEFVVVDGGSTDGTVDAIRDYDARIREDTDWHVNGCDRRMVWISEPDQGIYDAMNKGIHMATGDVIAVFNDAFARTDAISMLVTALEREHADGVHSDLVYVDGDTCKRWWRMGDGGMRTNGQGLTAYPGLHTGWMPAHPTLYLRRQVYESFGDYDTSMRSSADYDYMLRILTGDHAIRLAYVPEVLIRMFYGGTSSNGAAGYARNIKEAYAALRRNRFAFPVTAILCRMVRTLVQYRTARRYKDH